MISEVPGNKNEKDSTWAQIEKEVLGETDSLGREIDKGIEGAVVAFNAMGFPTSQSCGGHMDRALPHPWVHVSSLNEPPMFEGENEDEMEQRLADKYKIDRFEIYNEPGDLSGAKKEAQEWWRQKFAQGETEGYKKWEEKNIALRQNMELLLGEFYLYRETDPRIKLHTEKIGNQSFRVLNGDNIFTHFKKYGNRELLECKLTKDLNEKEREELEILMPKLREEMNAFAEFLKAKFYNQ